MKTPAAAAEPTASLKQGKADLKSAGPLTFGPEGILFVGDTRGAALCAINTGDRAPAAEKRVIAAPGGPPPVGPYSPGLLAGDYLYVSGQGAARPQGGFPESAEEQARPSV